MVVAIALIAFLVGCGVGVLVLGFVVLSRMAERTGMQLAEVAEHLRSADAAARQLVQEQIQHRDATNAVLVVCMQNVGRGLAAEVREAAKDQRNTMRLLFEALPRATPTTKGWPPPRNAAPAPRRGMAPAMPGALLLSSTALTPPSGSSTTARSAGRHIDTKGSP